MTEPTKEPSQEQIEAWVLEAGAMFDVQKAISTSFDMTVFADGQLTHFAKLVFAAGRKAGMEEAADIANAEGRQLADKTRHGFPLKLASVHTVFGLFRANFCTISCTSQRPHLVIVAHDQRQISHERLDDLAWCTGRRDERGFRRQRRRGTRHLHRDRHLDNLRLHNRRLRCAAGEQQVCQNRRLAPNRKPSALHLD